MMSLVFVCACAQMRQTVTETTPAGNGQPERTTSVTLTYAGGSDGARDLVRARQPGEIAQTAINKGMPATLSGGNVQAGWNGFGMPFGMGYGNFSQMPSGPMSAMMLSGMVAQNGGMGYLPPLAQPIYNVQAAPPGTVVVASQQMAPCPEGRAPQNVAEQASCAALSARAALKRTTTR